jgi:hypothetical protein
MIYMLAKYTIIYIHIFFQIFWIVFIFQKRTTCSPSSIYPCNVPIRKNFRVHLSMLMTNNMILVLTLNSLKLLRMLVLMVKGKWLSSFRWNFQVVELFQPVIRTFWIFVSGETWWRVNVLCQPSAGKNSTMNSGNILGFFIVYHILEPTLICFKFVKVFDKWLE